MTARASSLVTSRIERSPNSGPLQIEQLDVGVTKEVLEGDACDLVRLGEPLGNEAPYALLDCPILRYEARSGGLQSFR
jgi:hypothetical protein